MKLTKHCQTRMSQRGVSKEMLNLALEFGENSGDKLVLNRKTTQKVINDIDMLMKVLIRAKSNEVGTVVVGSDTFIAS